jgi:hypothetical protein
MQNAWEWKFYVFYPTIFKQQNPFTLGGHNFLILG